MNVKTTIIIVTTLILNCTIASLLLAATIEYTYGNDGRLTKADYGGIAFNYNYDLTGNILGKSIEILSTYNGDLDNDGAVDLVDSILALQVVSGQGPAKMVHRNSDVDGDLKLGLGEVIYILKSVAQEP